MQTLIQQHLYYNCQYIDPITSFSHVHRKSSNFIYGQARRIQLPITTTPSPFPK